MWVGLYYLGLSVEERQGGTMIYSQFLFEALRVILFNTHYKDRELSIMAP